MLFKGPIIFYLKELGLKEKYLEQHLIEFLNHNFKKHSSAEIQNILRAHEFLKNMIKFKNYSNQKENKLALFNNLIDEFLYLTKPDLNAHITFNMPIYLNFIKPS